MQLPEVTTQPRKTYNTQVNALARAFRWKRMLESVEFASIAKMAEREGIAPTYMTRVLRLTLLAPDVVEAILDGKQAPGVILARFLEPFPAAGLFTTRSVEYGFACSQFRKSVAGTSIAPSVFVHASANEPNSPTSYGLSTRNAIDHLKLALDLSSSFEQNPAEELRQWALRRAASRVTTFYKGN